MKKIIAICFLVLICISAIFGQDTTKVKKEINFGADINSRYIYRGLNLGQTPSIQPYLNFNINGFEIGTFGAFGTNSNYFKVNTYLSYNTKLFTFMLLDIFVADETQPSYEYFDWDKNTTHHSIEPSIEFKGTDKFPIDLLAATVVYGWDLDTTGSMYYSTYFEIGHYGQVGSVNYRVFMGLTPWEGFYGDDFGVVNLGIKVRKKVFITERFGLPLSASFILNPQKENVYLVFGISF